MITFQVIEAKEEKRDIVYVQIPYISVFGGMENRCRFLKQKGKRIRENSIYHDIGRENYEEYSEYFSQLMDVVSRYISNFKFVLNVKEKVTILELHIPREEKKRADKVQEILQEKFKRDIEAISIKQEKQGVCLNIIDFFYECN